MQVTLEAVLGRGGGGTVYKGELTPPLHNSLGCWRKEEEAAQGLCCLVVCSRLPPALCCLVVCSCLPPAVVCAAGSWRGLPVAVKTFVFEAWEGGSNDTPAALAESKRMMRAVMETALSASLGHLHVVRAGARGSPHGHVDSGRPVTRGMEDARVRAVTHVPIQPRRPEQCPQVATYHYDIKRMDEQADALEGCLQVRRGACGRERGLR